MYEATLDRASNRADWIVTIELVDDDTNQIITDLSDISAVVQVRSQDKAWCALRGSDDDGHILFTPYGVIQWHFTADEMGRLQPGTYEVGLTITRDNVTEQELIAYLPVVDGVIR